MASGILQEEMITKGALSPGAPFMDMESRHVTRYTVASINEPIADSLFTYKAPAGFRELDRLDPAFPRPAADLLGKPAPEITLSTLDGKPAALSSQTGKVVLLDFWATWCKPCRDQIPFVAALYREAGDQGLVVLGINDDENQDTALTFAREQRLAWPSLFDGRDHKVRESY
jgi:thiol-disulfide isomerase/thioredoxin